MLVLAIESSTSSAKALLYDSEKGVVGSRQQNYGPELGLDGRTDTRGVFELTMQNARELAQGKDIAAIGLSSVWPSVAVCDENMNPLTPTFSWNFTGSAYICDRIRQDDDLTERLYRNSGCMPHNTYPCYALSWLDEQGFDYSGRKLPSQGGYNFFRLTGEFLESYCIQSSSGFLNLFQMDYDEFCMDYFKVKRDQLGTLATWRDSRPLTAEAAKLLGLRPGIPVIPSHGDGALNQIGSGAGKKGRMTLSVGTSGALRLTSEKPMLPEKRSLWCYCGVDKWITGAAISGACNCVNWFMNTLMGGKASYDELEGGQTEDGDVPAFLPFLFGERCPGWNGGRRGGFFFVDGSHTPADFYKGLQMGIIFNLRQCFELLVEEHGRPQMILASGGILNSLRWTQMLADILGQDILAADYPNASAMGAAALALACAGDLKDPSDFVGDSAASSVVTNRPEKQEYYQRQYERYLAAYNGQIQ